MWADIGEILAAIVALAALAGVALFGLSKIRDLIELLEWRRVIAGERGKPAESDHEYGFDCEMQEAIARMPPRERAILHRDARERALALRSTDELAQRIEGHLLAVHHHLMSDTPRDAIAQAVRTYILALRHRSPS